MPDGEGKDTVLVLDQLGGIHLEGFGQLADVVYARAALPVAALQAADVVRVQR
jgi:hypothetical protein